MGKNLEFIKEKLESDQGIMLVDQLLLGNNCKNVFRAFQHGNSVVVKIGLSEAEKNEILKNKQGYKCMAEIGAFKLMPKPLVFIEIEGVPLIIMQDCGPDFWHAVKTAAEPILLYRQLASELESIYSLTMRAPEEAHNVLEDLRDYLIKQYQEFLFPKFGQDLNLVALLKQVDFNKYLPKQACFSSFDFTPEDVFITPLGLKFVDPPTSVVGIPIIDMACFAGVALDAYNLPGSVEGYNLLRYFALVRIPQIIGLRSHLAIKLFSFGRALQLALSSRFRINQESQRALTFFEQSCNFCKEFLETKEGNYEDCGEIFR